MACRGDLFIHVSSFFDDEVSIFSLLFVKNVVSLSISKILFLFLSFFCPISFENEKENKEETKRNKNVPPKTDW